MSRRESASRQHQTGIALRNCKRQACRNHRTFTRFNREINAAVQIKPRITLALITRHGHLLIEKFNRNFHRIIYSLRMLKNESNKRLLLESKYKLKNLKQ